MACPYAISIHDCMIFSLHLNGQMRCFIPSMVDEIEPFIYCIVHQRCLDGSSRAIKILLVIIIDIVTHCLRPNFGFHFGLSCMFGLGLIYPFVFEYFSCCFN